MRALVTSLSIVALAGSAVAQPGAQPQPQPQPYPAPQPYPQPYPSPQPYAPPPYAYAPQPLTAEEQELLARGEISDGAHFGGAVLAFFLGFGTGQAAQGRWGDTGWIFTIGEIASMALIIRGAAGIGDDIVDDRESDRECTQCISYIVIGAIALSGLRLWGTIDAIAAPSSHNARVREVRMKAGIPMPYYSLAPYVAPTRDGGGTAGVTLRF
jgi:hypothetical protein